MTRIVAVTAHPSGGAHAIMAAEALQRTARFLGHTCDVEVQSAGHKSSSLDTLAITAADLVLLGTNVELDISRFAGKPLYRTSTSEAIRHSRQVIEAGCALLAPHNAPTATPEVPDVLPLEPVAPVVAATKAVKRLVGITSCPTGIAHTFMAAEALQKAARALGYEMKVETQGSVGSKNTLTPEEIAAADAVVIAADTKVDTSRFAGKPLLMTGTKDAMHHGRDVIEKALLQPAVAAVQEGSAGYAASLEAAKAQRSASRTGPYKHLMTGVSYMLPLLVAGGLCIALAFATGGIYASQQKGTLGAALSTIGGDTAFHLFVAVLSAFIAFSIADRPGLAPGLIGGMLAQNLGAGFLGGILSGFLAGYLTLWLANTIRLPQHLEGLKPVLILPLLSTLIVGLAMIYVIAPPVGIVLNAMTAWLNQMRGANAVVLGLLLGAMMAFDMGGPINKASYTFAVGLLASQVYTPMAAVVVAGMTPPLGLALAATLFPRRFDADEREARGPALVLGLAFITEGAIPFAAKDPLRVIPALMAGSAVAGAISMAAGVGSRVPHGGLFAAVIPGAVLNLPVFLLAAAAGTVVTTAALFVLKRPIEASPETALQGAGPAIATASVVQ